jgi:hypothetical protein
MDLVGNRYNPPISMSKRSARKWAEIGPSKTKHKDPFGKDITKTPVDLYGKIYDDKAAKKLRMESGELVAKTIRHTVTEEHSGMTMQALASIYFSITATKCRPLILKVLSVNRRARYSLAVQLQTRAQSKRRTPTRF